MLVGDSLGDSLLKHPTTNNNKNNKMSSTYDFEIDSNKRFTL
jgi:hypothetical protein